MHVPSYQMHNVLNVYSRQLKQNVSSAGNNNPAERMPSDRVKLTPEGRRRTTIEKVSRDILNKITRFCSLAEARQRITENDEESSPNETAADERHETTFVFNAIDSVNQKITNTLSVEDSGFLIQNFEQTAKKSGNKKTESWV